MTSMFTLIIYLFITAQVYECYPNEDEPVCTSRYDYEHKTIRSIINMEIEQEKMSGRIDDLKRAMEEQQERHKDAILSLEKTIKEKEAAISSLVSRVTELTTNSTVYMVKNQQEKNFNYKDILAQATCRALVSGGQVNAVRRSCSSSYSDCNGVCKNVGRTCYNSVHVYEAKAMTAKVGQIGLQMYRYDNCGGGCGPNYCCCRS